MSETNYFWQGGRRIEIRQDDAAVTIHAESAAEAESAATRAGVELRAAATAAPGLIQAEVMGDRDGSIDRLRADDNVVHHVYRDRQEPESEYLITESFFIKFKPETPENRILDYFAAEHLAVEQELGDKTYLARVTAGTGRNPIRTANAAATRDDVEYAEPNLVRRLMRFAFIPPDPLFAQQWHLHAPAAIPPDLVAGAGISAPEAWDLTRGRRESVVAVADDGFDLTHPDFQGDDKVVARLNATIRPQGVNAGIDWDSNVSPRAGDYHGTPCLGVAVAEGNGTGVVGVAPGCSLVAVRFPLSMSDPAPRAKRGRPTLRGDARSASALRPTTGTISARPRRPGSASSPPTTKGPAPAPISPRAPVSPPASAARRAPPRRSPASVRWSSRRTLR